MEEYILKKNNILNISYKQAKDILNNGNAILKEEMIESGINLNTLKTIKKEVLKSKAGKELYIAQIKFLGYIIVSTILLFLTIITPDKPIFYDFNILIGIVIGYFYDYFSNKNKLKEFKKTLDNAYQKKAHILYHNQ